MTYILKESIWIYMMCNYIIYIICQKYAFFLFKMICGYTTEYVLEHGMAHTVISIITRIVQERNAWFRCHKKKSESTWIWPKIRYIFSGWCFQPLWKIWLRQLGWLFPIYGKMIHSCSKPRFIPHFMAILREIMIHLWMEWGALWHTHFSDSHECMSLLSCQFLSFCMYSGIV